MSELINDVLCRAVAVVLSRAGDVNTEDGSFATVSINDIILLEESIVEAFDLDSDDVNQSDAWKIAKMISDL